MTLPVDVRFDVFWRVAGQADATVVSTMHHFEPFPPGPNQYDAVPFEADIPASAVAASAGDRLVLRFTVTGGSPGTSYTPNGDGSLVRGRIPNLTLP